MATRSALARRKVRRALPATGHNTTPARRTSGHRGRKRAWIEHPRFIRLLKALTGRSAFPTWTRVQAEAQGLRDEVAAKRISWPPPSVEGLSAVLKGTPTAVAEFDPRSLHVGMQCPSIQRRVARATTAAVTATQLAPEVRQLFLGALAAYHSVLLWRAESRRVLQVHRQLFEDIANGEAPSIDGFDLEMPFPACYIEFPRGVTMRDPLDPVRRLPVDGVLATVEDPEPWSLPRRELRLVFVGVPPRRWPRGVDPLLVATVGLDDRSLRHPRVLPPDVVQRIHVPQDLAALASTTVPLPADGDLPPAAENDIVTVVLALLHDIAHRTEDRVRDRGRHARVTRPGRPRGSGTGASGDRGFTSYYFHGRKHAKTSSAGGWRRGRPLAFIVHVRPHMRNQACGPGLRLRKRIRIKGHTRAGTKGVHRTTRSRVD